MSVYLAAYPLMASHRIQVAGAADLLRATGASMDAPCVLSSPKLRDLAIHAIGTVDEGSVNGSTNGSADVYGRVDATDADDAAAAASTPSSAVGGGLGADGDDEVPSGLSKHHPSGMHSLHVCPIHLATLNRNCDVVATLLEAGASVNMRVKMATGGVGGGGKGDGDGDGNGDGKGDGDGGVSGMDRGTGRGTASGMASHFSDTPVDSLHIAVSIGDLDTLQFLLQAGAVPSDSCLHCAVSWLVGWSVDLLIC